MNKSIRKTIGVIGTLIFMGVYPHMQVMATPIQERITAEDCNLMLDDNNMFVIVKGEKVNLQSIVDEKYAVISYGNKQGKILRKNLKYPVMYVYRAKLNLRDAPVNGKVIETMPVNSRVSVIEYENGWAKIIYQGKIGYSSLEYLTTKNIIGSYSTKLSNNSNNVNNIRVASNFINGKVVKAGTTFSFLNAIGGESTRELGYLPATVIVNGKKTTGLGGGVCQVSSTLYAAIKSISDSTIIKVTERYPHSLPVGYISKDLEATVAYPSKDLKFIPTCDVQIESSLQNGRIYVNIIKK